MELTTRIVLVLLLDGCVWLSCCAEPGLQDKELCRSEDCKITAKRILDDMDPSVDPCQDFFRFTCGRFLENAVIPSDSDRISSFTETTDVLRNKMKSVVFERISSNEPRPYRLLKTFMKLCMDEGRMDAVGLEPALRRLKRAGGWPVLGGWNSSQWDLVTTLATLDKVSDKGADSLFGITADLDFKNTSRRVIHINDPKQGLDRKILIAGLTDTRVQAYYDFMVDVAVIFGAEKLEARKQLKRSLMFEIEVAKLLRPEEKKRNFEDMHHPVNLQQLTSQVEWLDWRELLNQVLPKSALPLREDDVIILSDPEYLKKVGELVIKHPPRTVSNYIMCQVARRYSVYSTQQLRNRLLLLVKELQGIVARKPRWNECIQLADISMEHIMGSIYVKNFFNQKSRQVANKMMLVIHDEMKRLLEENQWMDDQTRKKALEKVAKMHHHVGYPDELLDMDKLNELYAGVDIKSTDDFLSAVVQLHVVGRELELGLIRTPVNRTDWRFHSNVNVINAFYSPFENAVTIPAGILQHLFFHKDLPIYVNLGKIGFVMGHEITHGFDDEGSQMDKDGNLKNWWAKESSDHFKEKTRCMVDQFSSIKDNATQLNVNGITLQGETVADQGGMKLVHRAVGRLGQSSSLLPGLQNYTREQVMLISMGNMWCEKRTLQSRKIQLLIDPHPASDFRVNGIAINFPHFQQIFNCHSSDPMVSKAKCLVW